MDLFCCLVYYTGFFQQLLSSVEQKWTRSSWDFGSDSQTLLIYRSLLRCHCFQISAGWPGQNDTLCKYVVACISCCTVRQLQLCNWAPRFQGFLVLGADSYEEEECEHVSSTPLGITDWLSSAWCNTASGTSKLRRGVVLLVWHNLQNFKRAKHASWRVHQSGGVTTKEFLWPFGKFIVIDRLITSLAWGYQGWPAFETLICFASKGFPAFSWVAECSSILILIPRPPSSFEKEKVTSLLYFEVWLTCRHIHPCICRLGLERFKIRSNSSLFLLNNNKR